MTRRAGWDVIVAGGGNAGLCAAIVAAEAGAHVLLLERAPEPFRGGNTRHTRNIRDVHAGADGFVTGAYEPDEFLADLASVSGPGMDRGLATLAIEASGSLAAWMSERGVGWQAPLRGTLHLARTNHFFLGGGKALVNAYFRLARRLGVTVRYEAAVVDLELDGSRCSGVIVEADGGREVEATRSFVAAAGGFEANRGWLRDYWGEAADRFAIRGTPYNEGRVLRCLLDAGARPVGDPHAMHAIAVDARGPDVDGGIVTRLDSIPFGIVVNAEGRRFYDEGEDLWPKRYATWGRLIAGQPGQRAYSILDARALSSFMISLYPPVTAPTIRELAEALGLDPPTLDGTVEAFNAATAEGTFDGQRLDALGTRGIDPPKSNWARPIVEPPFAAYPLRPGITFTYLGVAVDGAARVQRSDGSAFENILAAGEIMAGNILTRGYLAGFGLTVGSTFGRIAGKEAATHALG